jgi:hypothetical protein
MPAKIEADFLLLNNLTKPRLLLVLEHVDQHFWPSRPTRQNKADLLDAIKRAIRADRYDFRLQDSL